ncbi:hypothetical protein DPMN_056062 [Dreissena polymorpha]|uniref:Uncharacterized protein n=1 Tax=Dreissena polymorpha TaxID=45954 RepID=A0A9D4CR17_DREPO|nr:hypothetical protein DPMN_056062 [Dreissena polymorpha]
MEHHNNNECKAYIHANPMVSITRYEVARLTARPYGRAFSPDNITSAFRKAGIYPFNPDVITLTATAPSSIYKHPLEMLRDDAESTSAENLENKANTSTCKTSQNFFEERTLKKNVTVKPRKKFTQRYKLPGSLMSDENMKQIKLQHQQKIQL